MGIINVGTGNDIVESPGYSFLNIVAATTTVVKASAGTLIRVIVNKAVATDTITIYNNTAGSGTKIGTITVPAAVLLNQLSLDYECVFSIGLTVVTSGTDDLTVVYK